MQLNGILFSSSDSDFADRVEQLKGEWSFADFLKGQSGLIETVRAIVDDVAKNGDAAVAKYTNKFDDVSFTADDFRVSADEIKRCYDGLDEDLLSSLRGAIENVKAYQSAICLKNKAKVDGIKYMPLKRVGICVPGASAPLPSTVIMTAVPAIVAGVEEIVLISPPRCQGSINPVILGLCYELGITEAYRVSGSQGVAALGWGTETIKKVDKIVGPGNDFVQMAKKEVFGLVDIDSFAGPSDVIIIANEQANPAWVAADMLSQAEHAPGAAILLTHCRGVADGVIDEMESQLKKLSRGKETAKCLLENSAIIVTESLDESIDFANDFAAEHLEIQCGDKSCEVEKRIVNAGAIFVGPYTPVAVGDYWAGPSHTLPTRCTTKFFSALTSNDFLKSSSIISYSKDELAASANDIERLAMTEGLDAHANSVKIRVSKID